MNDSDKEKIIYFPELDERKKQEKERQKQAKQRQKLEEQYRKQYHAEKKGKKVPFVNWDKIPPFTRAMIGIFILIHLIIVALSVNDFQQGTLLLQLGFVPAQYTGIFPWHWTAIVAPVTSLFIHGSWIHLLFNCIMMMVMGIFCERKIGAKPTFKLFIISGLFGSLAFLILNPFSTAPVVGASGAINGLFSVAMLMMMEERKNLVGTKQNIIQFILLWCGLIIGIGLLSHNTAWQSHLGGFLCGVAIYHAQKKSVIRLLW